MHADQLTVSLATVRGLIDSQFPQWRDLPVRSIASQGTVNAIFRVGDHLAARFPLKPGEVDGTRRWLATEAVAASELAGRTRFPTPEPVAQGEPGRGYPLPWSVQTWLPGTVASDDEPGESIAFAHDLAEFIEDVRAIDTRGRTFRGWGRGGDLPDHDLVGAWHLLEAGPRQAFRERLRCDELEWQRGQAWAFEQAMGAVWYYRESNPAMSRMGQRTLERLIADVGSIRN